MRVDVVAEALVHGVDGAVGAAMVAPLRQVVGGFPVVRREQCEQLAAEAYLRLPVHSEIMPDPCPLLKADVAAVYRGILRFLNVDADFQPDFSPANESRSARLPLVRQFLAHPPAWYRSAVLPIARQLVPAQRRATLNAGIDAVSLSDAPRQPMNPATRRALQQEFLLEIERLSDLLGRDLTHWCKESR